MTQGWWESIWYPRGGEGWLRRLALSPLAGAALLFRAAAHCRGVAYARGWIHASAVRGASVISIGNLNVGGTGKTPAVIYLANRCLAQGRRVAVLTRGYRRIRRGVARVTGTTSAAEWGDEAVLIARRCPEAIVLVGNDRRELAILARRKYGSDLMILDDGMQFRRLIKNLEVAVVDEAVGFGNGKLLPRGPLREPAGALARADLVWLRAAPTPWLPSPAKPYVRALYVPEAVFSAGSQPRPPSWLRGRKVYAFAAVARPHRFLETLRELAAVVAGSRFFADHHRFSPAELEELVHQAKLADAELLITTEKDLVRLPPDFPAWAVRLEVKILEGAEALSQRLALL